MTKRRVTDWLMANPDPDADPAGQGFSEEELLEVRRMQDVARLVGLKRYEQPDAFFAQRNLARIREQVADAKRRTAGALVRQWVASPVTKLTAAAVCLLVMGLQVLSLSGLQPVTPLAHEPVRDFGETSSRQLVSTTNDVPSTVPWSGSLGPASIEYGTGPSQLVEFEF